MEPSDNDEQCEPIPSPIFVERFDVDARCDECGEDFLTWNALQHHRATTAVHFVSPSSQASDPQEKITPKQKARSRKRRHRDDGRGPSKLRKVLPVTVDDSEDVPSADRPAGELEGPRAPLVARRPFTPKDFLFSRNAASDLNHGGTGRRRPVVSLRKRLLRSRRPGVYDPNRGDTVALHHEAAGPIASTSTQLPPIYPKFDYLLRPVDDSLSSIEETMPRFVTPPWEMDPPPQTAQILRPDDLFRILRAGLPHWQKGYIPSPPLDEYHDM